VKRRNLLLAALAVIAGSACEVHSAGLQDIDTIVVIYAENRSFDNLYGSFPGANGLSQVTPAEYCSATARDPCSKNCRRCGTA
jgi:phospholipase C